jgi:hypothetical protein
MPYMNEQTRSLMIDDYDALIQEISDERDADAYYVNFMFNALPGKETTRFAIMNSEVTRVHSLLTKHAVRKWKSPKWSDLVPVLIGAPDYPVIKRMKADAKLYQVNEGLHFNAVVLIPSRDALDTPGKRSRLKESLDVHFVRKEREYRNSRLARIHVTPVDPDTTVTDYMLKAFRRGRITSDDILVLN